MHDPAEGAIGSVWLLLLFGSNFELCRFSGPRFSWYTSARCADSVLLPYSPGAKLSFRKEIKPPALTAAEIAWKM